MQAPQVVSLVLALVGVAVALVLLITGARGRSRVTGIIGSVLLLLSMISGLAYRAILDPMLGHVDDDTVIKVLAAQSLSGGVLTGAGLVLLTYAIIVANRLPKTRPAARR
ncbi:MAG: hypothetical protein J2P23_02910 [Microlunatus sp.]|nr:hypothetical protein [Microlunatus sp.]